MGGRPYSLVLFVVVVVVVGTRLREAVSRESERVIERHGAKPQKPKFKKGFEGRWVFSWVGPEFVRFAFGCGGAETRVAAFAARGEMAVGREGDMCVCGGSITQESAMGGAPGSPRMCVWGGLLCVHRLCNSADLGLGPLACLAGGKRSLCAV
jgi:hypothetical protein